MKALIIVDVQKDFCLGGNLAVPNGDEVIPLINKIQNENNYDLIIATQDFHPSNHKSFASNNPGTSIGDLIELNGLTQMMWPDHCIEGTKGADFHPDLNMRKVGKIFRKGRNPEVDSYSGFMDNDKKTTTGLGQFLKDKGISHIDIVGLAFDYCVTATAIDAKGSGFSVTILKEATRSVSQNTENIALAELLLNGITVK